MEKVWENNHALTISRLHRDMVVEICVVLLLYCVLVELQNLILEMWENRFNL